MKRVIAIGMIAVILLLGIACASGVGLFNIYKYIGSYVVMAVEEDVSSTSVPSSFMAVFYTKAEHIVLFAFRHAEITDNGDGTWNMKGCSNSGGNSTTWAEVRGIDQVLVAYNLYHFELIYADLSIGDTMLEDLSLQPIIASDLPHSMHIAALADVYMIGTSPRADVIRLYMGVQYAVSNCRVAQSAYDAYTDGMITVYNPTYGLKAVENKDCFVAVYFLSETAFDEEVQIPLILDKVIK